MSQRDHDEAIDKMAREAKADFEKAELPHWRRVIANDCRDGDGDPIVVPTRIRVRLPPPKYLVERQRWQGEIGTDVRGELVEPPVFVWGWEGDAGHPPQQMITCGIRGTEGLFQDQIVEGEDAERRAHLAAWAHYDQTHGRRGPSDG